MKKDWYKKKTRPEDRSLFYTRIEYIYDGTFKRNTEDWSRNWDSKWGLYDPEKKKIHNFYKGGAYGRAKRRSIRNKNRGEKYHDVIKGGDWKEKRKSQQNDSIRNAYANETMDLHISSLYSITSDSEIYYTKRPVHREMALYMSLSPRFGQKSSLLTRMILEYFTVIYNK